MNPSHRDGEMTPSEAHASSMQVTRRGFMALLAAMGAFGLASCSSTGGGEGGERTSSPAPSTEAASPEAPSSDGPYSKGIHHARIEVRDYGTIEVALNADVAPITVANFANLVDQGFYNGLTFHRVVSNFMIQGGDPKGDGTGGSDATIKGEFSSNGVANPISHVRGTISMARSTNPNSASSQFFIMQESNPSLNGQYAAFGNVTEGMGVVDAIVDATASYGDPNGVLPPDRQPVIEKITMLD